MIENLADVVSFKIGDDRNGKEAGEEGLVYNVNKRICVMLNNGYELVHSHYYTTEFKCLLIFKRSVY